MKDWNFENGIRVEESKYDGDLHCFECYNGDDYIGTVYPDDNEAMESCIECLEDGEDPVSGGWEDGLGNTCTLDGWGDAVEA